MNWLTKLIQGYAPVNGTREAWGRLAKLVTLLQTGDAFNATTLAKATGRCTKTMHRDLAWLRSQGVELIFDVPKRTFRLKPGSPIPPLLQLTQEAK